jgi:hypothetical protein
MGEPVAGSYTPKQVARLLGLHEASVPRTPPLVSTARRHITILDVVSWLHDPGGDQTVYHRLLRGGHPEAWHWKRGPLPPDSTLALILWDFERAMKRYGQEDLKAEATLALTVFGFNDGEIALLLYGSPNRRPMVSRALRGRRRTKVTGFAFAAGVTVPRVRGIREPGRYVTRLTDLMNGEEGS